jgi:hypothetical protein
MSRSEKIVVVIVSCMPAPVCWWHGFHLAGFGADGMSVKRTVVALGATVDPLMIASPCACSRSNEMTGKQLAGESNDNLHTAYRNAL